ncbi:hypothetical protein ACJX0J_035208 [Zea mays]
MTSDRLALAFIFCCILYSEIRTNQASSSVYPDQNLFITCYKLINAYISIVYTHHINIISLLATIWAKLMAWLKKLEKRMKWFFNSNMYDEKASIKRKNGLHVEKTIKHVQMKVGIQIMLVIYVWGIIALLIYPLILNLINYK